LDFINRIKKKIGGKSQYDMQSLLNDVNSISSTHSKMVICPDNTDANWLGVKNATLAMFPEQTFVIPQHFSNQIVSDEDLKLILSSFKEKGGNTVVLSGFPNYFFNVINICKGLKLKVELIFHGGLAELNQNPTRQKQMETMLSLAKSKELSKIYVVKEGLDKLFTSITNVETERITPPLSLPEELKIKKFNDGKTHIGVFGNNSYNKNRHIQVAAGALIPNSVIHIIGENEFSYLLPENRVISHKQLDRLAFLELLGSMDINLYCSYSESWGQVTLESIQLGVPCLSGNNSGIINYLKPEHKKYIMNEVDNPYVIASKIKEILG
jgi:hypothetical protein